MNKSFAFALSVVGVVSAVAGASPAMAKFGSTGNVNATAAGASLAITVFSTSAPANKVSTSGLATLGANGVNLSLTPVGAFVTWQSLVTVTCGLTSSESDYSTGPLNTANCAGGTVTSAEVLLNVN
jgi:hypothetical protein